MRPRHKFFVEVVWLLISFIIALITTSLISGWKSIFGSLKIEGVYSSYIFESYMVIIPFFIFITFCIFYLKELKRRFALRLPVIIIIISGIASILVLTISTNFLVNLGPPSGGWTVYPDLSGISGAKNKIELRGFPFFTTIINWIVLSQLVIISCLLFMVYQRSAGKYKAKS